MEKNADRSVKYQFCHSTVIKIITTSGGGMILSENKSYIRKAKKLSTQSREKKLHYEHIEIGYNYRMSNILASIGLAQLHYLDSYVNKTREILVYTKKIYNASKESNLCLEINGGRSTNWLSAILLKDNSFSEINKLINYLEINNVEARPIWKPLPMHLQPLYHKCILYREKSSFRIFI